MKVQFKHTYSKRKNVLVNLPTVFPHVFCNLADRSSVKTNQEIMKFTGKKTTHITIQVQAFQRKPKKLTSFVNSKWRK